MKRDLKQVILLRRDLRLRRADAAALAAKASMSFIVEANETDRSGDVQVNLSGLEAEWLLGTATRIIVGISSEELMKKILLKAEIHGIATYEIMGSSDDKDTDELRLIAAALGPDESEKLDLITGNLKLF